MILIKKCSPASEFQYVKYNVVRKLLLIVEANNNSTLYSGVPIQIFRSFPNTVNARIFKQMKIDGHFLVECEDTNSLAKQMAQRQALKDEIRRRFRRGDSLTDLNVPDGWDAAKFYHDGTNGKLWDE